MTSELEKRLQDVAQGRARLLQAHSRAEDCRARLEKSRLYQESAEANAEAIYLFLILIGFTLAQFAMNRRRKDLY